MLYSVRCLDARCMEVYAQVFDRALKEIRPIHADVVDAETYKDILAEGPVYFFGNGAENVWRLSATIMPN